MKTYRIHLIRHGMTDANILGRYIGCRTDLPLSPEGVDELRLLREELSYPAIQKLYTSPMLRCRQTAGVLFPALEPQTVDKLREYDFGDFEGKTAEQLEGYPAYADWTAGRIQAPPGGEETTDFIKRVCIGINEVVRDMMACGVTDAGVIMHGGAIMMLLANTAVPRRRAVEWTSDNGRGYSVRINPSLYHSSGVIEVYGVI